MFVFQLQLLRHHNAEADLSLDQSGKGCKNSHGILDIYLFTMHSFIPIQYC